MSQQMGQPPGPPNGPNHGNPAPGHAPGHQPHGEPSKIIHSGSNFGGRSMPSANLEPEPVQMADNDGPINKPKSITAFGKESRSRHEDQWQRTPNTTGAGAIHCKTFHSKLTDDALRYLDQMINEWLDQHPQYEVKFVNSTVGTLTGKLKEPHLICQVWV